MRKYELPDGSILHAELQIDDSVIMIGDIPEQAEKRQQLVHIYVPNVDEIFQKAKLAGCIPLEEPHQRKGDPEKRGSFKDFDGNTWSIATQINH